MMQMSVILQFKWEFVLAIVVVVCATVALVSTNLTQENFIYVLGLAFTFLGGLGYGAYRARRQ